jgi:hypothetical protein
LATTSYNHHNHHKRRKQRGIVLPNSYQIHTFNVCFIFIQLVSCQWRHLPNQPRRRYLTKVLLKSPTLSLLLNSCSTVSLWGEISGDTDAISPIINRFTMNTEITQKLNLRDIIFEPNEEAAIGEPLYLRCRCDKTKSDAPWCVAQH